MQNFRHLEFQTHWKNFISKINPKIASYSIKDNKNFLLAWGAKDSLVLKNFEKDSFNSFTSKYKGSYLFGYISYDAKNQFETKLKSQNIDHTNFPEVIWFLPNHIILSINGEVTYSGSLPDSEIERIVKSPDIDSNLKGAEVQRFKIEPTISAEKYKLSFEKIQHHLNRGNIYEVNYCQDFASSTVKINPIRTFIKLTENTEAPFSSYFKADEFHVICGSPERFITLNKNRLTSQPIKGTAKRLLDKFEDDKQANSLLKNKKELSENIMIVDLVRNDLSKIAERSSVLVEELNSLYTFKSVHQLVSTISCTISQELSILDILEALFPMGSMTGAPKFSALNIIEETENFKRGIYSGTIGFVEPNGNFDLNVVIRTILYNSLSEKLSIPVGGAITALSNCQDEYQECLTKLDATKRALC